MRKILAFPLFILLIASCSSRSSFEIKEVKIITKNAEKLGEWYSENLEFEVSVDQDLLYHSNLTILLEEKKKARHLDTLKQAYNIPNIPGFFKLGFITNQFDNLVDKLRENKVEFVGGVVYDQKLDKRMLVIKDPEGNRIQVFEDKGQHKLKPYLLSLVVEEIGPQEKWYQMRFPVMETYNNDRPDQGVFIRLLKGEDFLIELIKTTDRKIRSEIDYSAITGFHHVEIRGAKATFSNDYEGNKIINP